MHEVTRTFRAMNTDVRVVVLAGDAREAGEQLDSVEVLFAANEQALSRFRPDSELSALNASAGAPFHASPLLFDIVRAAVEAAHWTSGIFDPTILPALVSAGYDRSFELLSGEPQPAGSHGGNGSNRASVTWKDIELDRAPSTITLPAGCALDLGGIGKGWTVDRAVELLSDWASFGVDAGGDLYVSGRRNDEPWIVGIADPRFPSRNLAVIELQDQAVTTSSVMRRSWMRGSELVHHLIDPRTQEPSHSTVISATVIADSVARAEVLAKSSLILGVDEGLRLLETERARGLMVLQDGELVTTNQFQEVIYA